MYPVLSAVIANIKGSNTVVDNPVFCLHYKVTCWLLIAFSIVVTSNQFFGDPINCFTASNHEIPEKVINNYCWIRSTFTLPGAYDKLVGVDVVQPGVDKSTPGEPVIYHAYYQWVCFYLFIQACMFYIPRALWRSKEGGKISKLVMGLNAPIIGSDEDIREETESSEKTPLVHTYGLKNKRVNILAQFLQDSMGQHRWYTYFYFLCEALNMANVIGQIYLTDAFLGGEFTTYGTEVIRFSNTDQSNRTDPMIKVFPRVTKCTFHRFGPTGDVQKHDIFCVLPVNVINEKIFIFLWFWFIVLACVSGAQLVYRLLILIPRFRWMVLGLHTPGVKGDLQRIRMEDANVGDWFVLRLLQKNLIPMNFQAVLQCLAALSTKSV